MSDRPQQVSSLDARDDLLAIVDAWSSLVAALEPGGGKALTGMPRGGESSGLPINVGVSDLMHEIEHNLARYYARILMDETEWEPTTSAMPQLLREVAARHGHFTEDEMLGLGFCDDAHDFRERVRKVIAPPAPATYMGPCRTYDCDGELRARDGEGAARCPTCGAVTTIPEQRMYLHAQLDERLMTVPEIIVALKMLDCPASESTVRRWITRGDLVEAVRIDGGMGLYPLAQAKALAERRVTKVGVAA